MHLVPGTIVPGRDNDSTEFQCPYPDTMDFYCLLLYIDLATETVAKSIF